MPNYWFVWIPLGTSESGPSLSTEHNDIPSTVPESAKLQKSQPNQMQPKTIDNKIDDFVAVFDKIFPQPLKNDQKTILTAAVKDLLDVFK